VAINPERRLMVRVMRKHVSGFDGVSSDELLERIAKLEMLLSDPEHDDLGKPRSNSFVPADARSNLTSVTPRSTMPRTAGT
jgi:hypothetical protein